MVHRLRGQAYNRRIEEGVEQEIVRKRESAKRDLIAQWAWCAENADIDTADRFLGAADSTVSMLAGQINQKLDISALREDTGS